MNAPLRILVDVNCLQATKERLFPESRHRSQRIRKKLIRRHGGEYRMQPAIFRIGADTLLMHPARYAELKAATASGREG